MTWDIVLWKDEDKVSYVPSCWANASKTLYKFPTTQNELLVRKYIHECNDLKVEFNWNAAEAKKINISSLKEAKRYCEKAEYTSQLDTNDENDSNEVSRFGRRRKKRKNSTSGSETSNTSTVLDDSEDESLNDVKKKTNQIRETQLKIKNVTGTPSLVGSEQNLQSIAQKDCFAGKKTHPAANKLVTSQMSQSQPIMSTQDTYRNLSRHTVTKQRLLLSRTRSKSLDREETLQLPSDADAPPSNSDIQIYKQLMELKFELQDVSHRIINMEKLLVNFMSSAQSPGETSDFPEFLDKLPLNNVDDINAFNGQIVQDRCKFKKLVQLLFLIGGDSLRKIVYGQMSKLITNDICKEYTGMGKTKKKSFTELKLYDAIVVSTRKRLPNVSESDIKKTVALFLTTYKSRCKKPSQEAETNIPSVINNGN